MKIKLGAALVVLVGAVALALVTAQPAVADPSTGADNGTDYYLSLGDSLAAGTNATGIGVAFTDEGYAERLRAALAVEDPKLELVKLGCPRESTSWMRFGSRPPTTVGSCGTPRYYKNVLYPRGTQLAEAVSFLQARKGKVALVTVDIGGGDLQRLDAQGDLAICLFEPAGCATQTAAMAENLTASLVDLRAAAGDPVADVAGAFENNDLTKAGGHVCAWIWFCAARDTHPNSIGYGVIAHAFAEALP
jgi:hypothetical protein